MQRKTYETRNEKTVDFLIGFVGWFILNGIFWLLSGVAIAMFTSGSLPFEGSDMQTLQEILTLVFSCLPLLINIGLLVFFAFRRQWIAMGMLSAFGLVLVIVICLAIFATAACFVMLGGYQ